MKIQKIITIDEDIYKLLKYEDNGSRLVNELLRKYYDKIKKTEAEVLEETKKNMEKLEEAAISQAKRDEATERLKKVLLAEVQENGSDA